jgi:hypothetical protein
VKQWVCLALALAVSGCVRSQQLPTPVPVQEGAFTVDVRTTATVEPLDSRTISLPQGLWDSNVDMLLPEGRRRLPA